MFCSLIPSSPCHSFNYNHLWMLLIYFYTVCDLIIMQVIKTHDVKIKTETLINGKELISHMQASIPIAPRLSKKTHWRKDSISKFWWKNWICRIMKLDPYLSLYIKLNSMWIKVIVHGTQFADISWRKKMSTTQLLAQVMIFWLGIQILHWLRPTTDKLSLF